MTTDATGNTTPTLYIKINGKLLNGWIDCVITRSAESCPSTYEMAITESFPGAVDISVTGGSTITIRDDVDVILTGYVDNVTSRLSLHDKSIHISGRSLCEDIVDSMNYYVPNSVSATSAVEYAKILCKDFDIKVVDETGGKSTVALPPVVQVNMTERVYDIIERLCRAAGLLCYDNPEGALVIAAIGNKTMGGKIVQGDNLVEAELVQSTAQRYSEYHFLWSETTRNFGPDGKPLEAGQARDPVLSALGRKRPYVGYSNQTSIPGQNVAELRAQWEASRRFGRGYPLRVTVTGWRDRTGMLWTPNALVKVKIPTFKLDDQQMIIASVSHRRTMDEGTTTELTLYPPAAFTPEPIQINDPNLVGILAAGYSTRDGNAVAPSPAGLQP